MTTLRAALADVYARAALDGTQGAQPTEEELCRALKGAVGRKLTPQQEKLLLKATLAHFDPRAAASLLPVAASAASGEPSDGAFSVEQIEALPSALWRSCLAWLLAREGYSVEEVGHGEESVTWRGNAGDSRVIAHGMQLPQGWLLDVEAVQRAAALAAAEPGAEVLLLCTSSATVGAMLAAQRLNVHIWDRAVLREALQRTDTAYVRAQEEAQDLTHERVQAASEARVALLAAVRAIEEALAGGANARRASGRRAVTTAAKEVATAKSELERAVLAWETLSDAWSAAFGERATREGALAVEADTTQLREMAERAVHLRQAGLQGARSLAHAPAAGDSAYVAWRQAVVEAVTARFEALRWRVSIIDPAQWQDFARAHDEDAAQRAARATTAARHAAARAEKAHAQLV